MSESYPDSGHLKLNYKTLYIGAIITLIITTGFVLIANYAGIKYEIRDVVAIFTCGIVSTTLIYHAKNLKINYEANQAKLDFDKTKWEEEKRLKIAESASKKKLYSYEKAELWFHPHMIKHVEATRLFLRENKDTLGRSSMEEIRSVIKQMDGMAEALGCVLNYFENMALLIKENIVEEEVIKHFFKTLFTDYYRYLKNFIDGIRHSSSRYLINYVELAKKWDTM